MVIGSSEIGDYLNENGLSHVTFIDHDSLLAKQAMFESVNGRQLGTVVQSNSVHEGNAYIMVNNADRVEIADAETFEEKGKITLIKR